MNAKFKHIPCYTDYVILFDQFITLQRCSMCRMHWQASRTLKYDHMTPVLKDIRWLPILPPVEYRMAMLNIKTLSAGEPSYLAY
jgi:hypothetical protein